MKPEDFVKRHGEAIEEFNRHENRDDGRQVASSLAGGLNVLRDSLYVRAHEDVERIVGRDSMLMPTSETRSERLTKIEIELYQIAESAAAVRDFRYISTDHQWYLHWLTRLRLGESQADAAVFGRLGDYLSKTPDDRRLDFADVLARILPESKQAPLVMFHLFPLSVQITTALGFGDHPRALDLRKSQLAHLPAIEDCRECRGRVLENGQQCGVCGNPLWKFKWLTVTD